MLSFNVALHYVSDSYGTVHKPKGLTEV